MSAAACPWWAWPHGSEALWRHLKRLNLVEIPAHRDEPIVGRRQIGAINRAAKTETVVFRHGDPHVIRLLMPILSPVQKALLFGGAAAIIADRWWRATRRQANRPRSGDCICRTRSMTNCRASTGAGCGGGR